MFNVVLCHICNINNSFYNQINTKMIITGDKTQVDLPHSVKSGLTEAISILRKVKGIAFVDMDQRDIVRHKLVTRIVEAYDKFEAKRKEMQMQKRNWRKQRNRLRRKLLQQQLKRLPSHRLRKQQPQNNAVIH